MAAFGVLFISTTLRTQVRPAIEFVSGEEGLRPLFWLFGVYCMTSLVFVPLKFAGSS